MLSAGLAAAGALTCSENVFREKTKKSDARRGNTALCIGFFAGCLLPGLARKLRAAYIAGAANQTRRKVNHIKKSTCFGTSIFGPSDWFRTSGLVVPKTKKFCFYVFFVIYGAFPSGKVCSFERCFRGAQVFRVRLWSEMWSSGDQCSLWIYRTSKKKPNIPSICPRLRISATGIYWK